jgi:hypothetical protein
MTRACLSSTTEPCFDFTGEGKTAPSTVLRPDAASFSRYLGRMRRCQMRQVADQVDLPDRPSACQRLRRKLKPIIRRVRIMGRVFQPCQYLPAHQRFLLLCKICFIGKARNLKTCLHMRGSYGWCFNATHKTTGRRRDEQTRGGVSMNSVGVTVPYSKREVRTAASKKIYYSQQKR